MKTIADLLQEWFLKNARDLPWRKNKTLYSTVVSEFMLQQTQVKTVLRYFEPWMHQFPDFHALAQAPEDFLLKAWEGLGYYARARNLQKLAQRLLSLHEIPKTTEAWEKLPGIGPYTAAAITSFCFKTPKAVVDGNVIRVFSRLLAEKTPFTSSEAARIYFTPIAQKYLPPATPDIFNESLMELGALICKQKNPLCFQCPIQAHCKAFKEGNPQQYPWKIAPKKSNTTISRLLVLDAKNVLLQKYDASAKVLSSLYEFPKLTEALLKKISSFLQFFIQKKRSIGNCSITEKFYIPKSTSEVHLHFWTSLLPNAQWISQERLEEITLSGPHRRWLKEFKRLLEFSEERKFFYLPGFESEATVTKRRNLPGPIL